MSRRSTLRLTVERSLASNDHQVKIWIDDRDVLQEHDAIGLDPDDFFLPAPKVLSDAEHAIVGRCSCGCLGCGDVTARIESEHPWVEWTIGGIPKPFRFVRQDYEAEIRRASDDRSWEDTDRLTERLVREAAPRFVDHLTRNHDLSFQWASMRADEKSVLVSLDRRGEQVLLRVAKNGDAPATLAERVIQTLARY